MGFDKAFLMEGNTYLLQNNARQLGSIFERVLLVSDTIEKLASHHVFGANRAVADHYPGTGPLGGICTALEEADAPYVFVMACDMPCPDLSLIELMHPFLGQAQAIVFEHEDKLETLFAFYHRSCLPVFTRQLHEGKLQPRRAFERLNVIKLSLSPERAGAAFTNLNTREDLDRWRDASASIAKRKEKLSSLTDRINERLFVPQLILVGAHGRNSGKTLLACDVIKKYGKRFPIYALKIISISCAGEPCHRGDEGCGMCTSLKDPFELIEENDPNSAKDTARMLQAGATKSFLLKSLKSCVYDAFVDFLGRTPKDSLIVCESNTLRKHVRPGVFLFASSEDGTMKPSAREVVSSADSLLPPGDSSAALRVRILKNADGSLIAVPAKD